MEKLTKFDLLDYFRTEEDFEAALQAAREDDPGDGSLIAATRELMEKAKNRDRLSAGNACPEPDNDTDPSRSR